MDYSFFLKGIDDLNKCLGPLECSPEIFMALESSEDNFIDDLVLSLAEYIKIQKGQPGYKFARYDTKLGNIVLYTRLDENKEPYTNILFYKELV